MFCKNCGNQIEDGAVFCPKCGASVKPEETTQTEYQAPQSESPVDKVKNVVVGNAKTIGIGAVAIVAVILLISLFSGGHKGTVKDFMKAFEKANAKKIVNLTIPKDIQEDYFDDRDTDKEEYIEDGEESLEDLWEELEDEDGKFSWEIKKVENLKKLDDLEDECYYEDLDEFRDYMEDRYDDYDLNPDKIKKAYAVEVKMTFEMDDEKESNKGIMIVYKYKGKWYINEGSLGMIF